MPQPHKPQRPKSNRLKFRFGIAAMLTVMLVTTVAASGGSYLWSAAQGKRIGLMVFFPFVLIVPFALMIFVSWFKRYLDNDSDNDDRPQYLG